MRTTQEVSCTGHCGGGPSPTPGPVGTVTFVTGYGDTQVAAVAGCIAKVKSTCGSGFQYVSSSDCPNAVPVIW